MGEATEAREEVDPEELLNEVVKRLEIIKKAQKAKADLNEEARLGGFRSTSGASDFERKMQHQIELLEQDGNDYEDIAATAASIICAGSSNPLPSSGKSKSASRRRRRGTSKLKEFSHVQGQIQALNPGWGAEIFSYQITKGSKKCFAPEPSQVLVNQDSLAHAVAWQGQFKLRCWVCPNDQIGHEFANCETALAGPNHVRLQALRDPKQGPGHQCFSCLRGTCFVERCLEQAKQGRKGQLSLCTRSTPDTECATCAQEIEADVKKKGRIKPYHTIVWCRDGHAVMMNPQDIISRLKPIYGEGTRRLHDHHDNIQLCDRALFCLGISGWVPGQDRDSLL